MVWNVADAELSTLAVACYKSHGSDTVDLPIGLIGEAKAELTAHRDGALFALVRLARRIFAIIKFGLELVKISLRGDRARLAQPVPGGSFA